MPTHACVMTSGAPSKHVRLGKANYCDSSTSLRFAKHETLFPKALSGGRVGEER
jgi:hypothetical protein